jgi:kynurenine formamidase
MFVDLSLTLSVTDPIFTLVKEESSDPLSVGHVGTHLDTYLGRPIPLEWSERRGVLVDVRDKGPEVLLSAINGYDVREGDFIIFRTGRIEAQPYGTREYFMEHPVLDWALIRALLARHVSFIGIDAAGIRRGLKLGDEHHRADIECEQSHAYVIENLTNLAALPPSARDGFRARLGWVAHKGASGVAVKVVADV